MASEVSTSFISGRHAVEQQANQTSSDREALGEILDEGLKLVTSDDLKSDCPDSWTFARYVRGQLDKDTRRTINAHIAFCNDCYREYVALAESEDIMKEVEQELQSEQPIVASDVPPTWP